MECNVVSKYKFKPHALEHFRQVEETGEEIVITSHGRPVLKVVPYVENPMEALQALTNTVKKYDNPFEPVAAKESKALRAGTLDRL